MLLIGTISSYNGMVEERTKAEGQASQVDVAYQTQFRLIPQITTLVEQYMANETEVMTEVAALRSGAGVAEDGSLQQKEDYSAQYARFIALVGNRVEAYPQLQAAGLYQDLITQTTSGENSIRVEKVRYNDYVTDFNTHIQKFPANLVAGMFGMEKLELIGFADRPNQSSFGDNQV